MTINSAALNVKKRIALFCSLLVFTLSLAFALSSLLTDFWIQVDSIRRNGTESRQNQMNSGLFHGTRELDWAFGLKQKPFSVYDELQSGVGFMDRHIWFGILFCVGMGILWNLVGILVAMRNAILEDEGFKSEKTALGPLGICLWATFSAASYGFCVLLFVYQFQTRIRANVLLPEEIMAGFSSENCSQFGFSFFLMLAAFITQMFTLMLTLGTFRTTGKKNKSSEKEAEFVDDSVFIY